MIPIQSKLPNTGTSIFTVMSALASEHNAINIGQGFPDFEMDQELAALASQKILEGYNQYAPMAGYMPLRESIAEKISSLYIIMSLQQMKSPSHLVAVMQSILHLQRYCNPVMK